MFVYVCAFIRTKRGSVIINYYCKIKQEGKDFDITLVLLILNKHFYDSVPR